MSESKTTLADEAVVRHYLSAIDNGRVLDALNAFSMDAQLRDEAGHERNGIREIAAAFATQAHPVRVEVEDIHREGETFAVRMRLTFPESAAPKEYRSMFRVDRERIHSLVMEPLPLRRGRRAGIGPSA